MEGFFFPLFFWNSLKEIGKEGMGRADVVQRSFGVSGDQQSALPKKPAPSLGLYCFTAKIRKAFPSEGLFKLETKKRERKQTWNEPNEDTTGPKQATLNFSHLFPTRSRRKLMDEKEVA